MVSVAGAVGHPAPTTFHPDRTALAQVACEGSDPDDDRLDGVPCEWEGVAELCIYDDTEEAIWWCPWGHENYADRTDFPILTKGSDA